MVDSKLDSQIGVGAASSVLAFCKMQALGNDFVVVGEDQFEQALQPSRLLKTGEIKTRFLSMLAQKICSRNFGVGADGFIVVRRGSTADRLAWTYLNSDGSESLMCGNGLRCLALWADENGWAPSKKYIVETGKGPVEIEFENAKEISSDLGEPILNADKIPAARNKTNNAQSPAADKAIIGETFEIADETFRFSCVNMGNPHCVIFEDNLEKIHGAELEKRAKLLQSNAFFPEGVNVEFVRVVSENKVRVIVFERGCGRTLACGSGAAAVVVAAVLEGRTKRDIVVELEGGALQLSWHESNNHVQIKGPASIVFKGQIDLQSLIMETQS